MSKKPRLLIIGETSHITPEQWEYLQQQGKIVGPEPEDESEHFMQCRACGQYFDMRDLGQVLHHEDPGHEPIPYDA